MVVVPGVVVPGVVVLDPPHPYTFSTRRHVDDMDLFPGGVSEQSVPGAVVGPTFGCIIADQIQHLRRGDRFWYENSNKVGFTPGTKLRLPK